MNNLQIIIVLFLFLLLCVAIALCARRWLKGKSVDALHAEWIADTRRELFFALLEQDNARSAVQLHTDRLARLEATASQGDKRHE